MAPARLAAPIRAPPLRLEEPRLELRLDREVSRPPRPRVGDVEVAYQSRVEPAARDRSAPVVDVHALDPLAVLLRQAEHPLDGRVLTRLAEREQRVPVGEHELGDPAGLREPHLAADRLKQALG